MHLLYLTSVRTYDACAMVPDTDRSKELTWLTYLDVPEYLLTTTQLIISRKFVSERIGHTRTAHVY